MNITFQPLTDEYIPLWRQWIEKKHVKDVWFLPGYATPEQILKTKQENGYDYPFMALLDNKPICYIQACDLYAYRIRCPHPKGLFTEESPGTFCMDLFIGEEDYLNKGYGTKLVKLFSDYIFEHFNAKKILIDPAVTNRRAIRCYEKAGFQFVREEFDGIARCYVMQLDKKSKIKGISHITLICQDLEKTSKMLQEILDAKEIYSSNENTFSIAKEKFFDLAGYWIAIMEGKPIEKTYNHLAFQVDESDFPYFEEKIRKLGLEILSGRGRNAAEGKSLYFYDYDNHLFELHSGNIETRLKFYTKYLCSLA